jgi:hypothetical protein
MRLVLGWLVAIVVAFAAVVAVLIVAMVTDSELLFVVLTLPATVFSAKGGMWLKDLITRNPNPGPRGPMPL